MTQIFTGIGSGLHGSSIGQLGSYGPKGAVGLGQGGESVYVNAANGNVVLKQTDGFLADFGVGLDVFQTYNSRDNGQWRFNAESSLQFEGDLNTPNAVVKRIDEDGHSSRFVYDAAKNMYVVDNGGTARLLFDGSSWSYREGSGVTTCYYNSDGQLSRLSDRDGHILQFHYQNGQLSSMTDTEQGQSVTWSYTQGLLTDVTFVSDAHIIHQLHYDYDSEQRLTRVSRALGNGETYWIAYDYVGDTPLISDIRQSDGTALHFDFDADGRLKCMVDGEGRTTFFHYQEGQTTVINALGERWTYAYDSEARLTSVEGPEQFHARYIYEGPYLATVIQGEQRWQLAYNETGDCVRIDDPSGQVTLRAYDNEHRLVEETRYQAFDENNHPIQPHTSYAIYDTKGHLRFEIAPDGVVTAHQYDANGSRINSRCYLNAKYTASTKTLEALSQWADLQPQQQVSLISYQYDHLGCLTEEIHYTKVDVDGKGMDTADAVKTYSRYDAAGRCVEKSSLTEQGLSTTHYFYDGLGRLTQTVDNQQHTQTITYDDAHQRIIKTDANGLQTLSIYDRSGLLLSTQRLDAMHDYGTTRYHYDSAGRLIAETDVDGKTRHLFYDGQGRLQGTISRDGMVTAYRFDAQGHCILTHQYQQPVVYIEGVSFDALKPQASPNDRIHQVIYNAHQQIAYQIDAQGAVIGYQYDAEGRVTSKRAYANRLNMHEGILASDLTLIPSADDRVMTYYYDAAGRLQGEIDGEGAATAYRYDAMGHLVERIRFANRSLGDRTGDWPQDTPIVSTSKDIHHYSIYNPAGLKIADLDAEGYLTTYTYDARGLLIESIVYYSKIKCPESGLDALSLDALRPKSHHNDRRTSYRYNDLGLRIEEKTQQGLVVTFAYDEMGQVVSKTSTDHRTVETRQQRYRYDALGRVIQSLDEIGAAHLQQASDLKQAEVDAIWNQHSSRYAYDNAGRLLSKTNALNQTTQYFYNDAGLLTFAVNADGEVTETRYNTFQQIETVIHYSAFCPIQVNRLTTPLLAQTMQRLADSRLDEVTHYEYNQLGLLVSQQQGKGAALVKTYNAFGELAQTSRLIQSGEAIVTRYDYDRRGLLRERIEDVNGIHKTYEVQLDVFGRVEKEWDGRLGVTSYRFNKRDEQIFIENQVRGVKSISYDAMGRVLSITDKVDEEYTYDDQDHTLTIERGNGSSSVVTQFNDFGDKISVTDGNHQITHFQYDARGQLIHIDAPEQTTTDYRYDEVGRLVFETHTGLHVVRYTYDAEGRVLTKALDPDGVNAVTTFTYDAIGRQLQMVDAGRCSRFVYDAEGRLIESRVDPEGLNLLTTYAYNDRGLLIREIQYNPEGPNKVTTYAWDALGRCLSKTLDPEGICLTTSYVYDQNDNVICQTDANQQATHFIYNANNQLRFRVDARGVVTEHVYSPRGNEIQTTIYAHRIPVREYYDESMLSSMIKPDDTEDHHLFFNYDQRGRLVLSYDGLGYVTQFGYDANDNILSKEYSDFVYSLSDLKRGSRPTPEKSSQLRITHFTYDGLNRQRLKIDVDGRVTESYYNAAGELEKQIRYANPVSIKDLGDNFSAANIQQNLYANPAKDQITRYQYDKAGRLTLKASAAGNVTAYHYDRAGNLVASCQYATPLSQAALNDERWFTMLNTSDADRKSQSLFDAAGREVYRISPLGRVIERRFDAVGNVLQEIAYAQKLPKIDSYTLEAVQSALQTSNTHQTDYLYDAAGRLLQKTEGLKTTRYTYDNNNNVSTKTEANQAIWVYHYDACNQLIETIAPPTIVKTYRQGEWIEETKSIKTQNQYDSFGNVTTIIRDVGGLNDTVHYVYDANNRKSQIIFPKMMVNSAGPKVSNERVETEQTLCESFTYNAFGEIIAETARGGEVRRWVYDETGHVIYAIDAEGGLTEYAYDAFENISKKISYANRLPLNKVTNFTRLAIRQAHQKSEDDRVEYYRYDQDNRLVETQKDKINAYDPKTATYAYIKPTKRLTYNAFGEVVVTAIQINRVDWAITTDEYDLEGQKVATLDAENYLTTYTYNDFGLLAEETQYAERAVNGKAHPSATDRRISFSYDALGQLTSKTLQQVTIQRLTGNGSHYESITQDLTSYYAYDAMGHLVATTDPQGNTAYAYYNETGQLIAKIGPVVNAGRAATTYSYDALGNLVESHQWANGASVADDGHFTLGAAGTADIITQDEYDNAGHIRQQTDGTGHQINYSYDAHGNVARTWQTLKQADQSMVIQDKRYTYDANQHLIETATLQSNGHRATDNAQYNAFGEVVRKGLNGVYATQIDYDLCGRVWRSNTQGFFQIYVYDLASNLTQIVTAANAPSHIEEDHILDLSDPRYETASSYDGDKLFYHLQRHDTLYDRLGHVIGQHQTKSLLKNDGTDSNEDYHPVTQVQTMDRWGNMLSHTTARGFTTHYTYNAMNQLTEQVLPEVKAVDEHGVAHTLRPVIRYAYDALGRGIAMTDANGHTVAKRFDANGHITQEIDALGYHRDKSYNLLNQLTSATNERGNLTTYVYDKANRLLSIATSESQTEYQYDGAGQLIQQSSGQHNTVNYFYDELGHQIKKTTVGLDDAVTYEYDDAGRKTLERDAKGGLMTWRYDDQGHLISHTDLGGHRTDYTYNLNGLLLTEQSTAGKNINYRYYSDGNLFEYDDIARKEVLKYAYDEDGNILSKQTTLIHGWNLEADQYQYDALGRLVQVSRHNQHDENTPDRQYFSIQYEYDAVGNIRDTKVDVNYVGDQHVRHEDYFLYDDNNRMIINKGQLQQGTISITTAQGSAISYDASGNIKSAQKYEDVKQKTYEYHYNEDNQLIRTQKDGFDLQLKAYKNGQISEEVLFDNSGNIAQHSYLSYEAGRLSLQKTEDGRGRDASQTQYTYDKVGNLKEMKTKIWPTGGTLQITQTHQYDYELWDSYLQSMDSLTVSAPGAETGSAQNQRVYDVNGQLKEAIDFQNGVVTNRTEYFSSSIEGVRARKDNMVQTSYLTVAGKTIGDLTVDGSNNQHLEVYGGFTPMGSLQAATPQSLKAFHNNGIKTTDADGTLPESPQDSLGTYTIQVGDTLDSLALQLYGDSSLWYLIADANGITDRNAQAGEKGGQLHVGQRLNIPQSASGQHQTHQTHKVLSSTTFTGNITASVSSLAGLPPAPPAHSKHHAFWKKMSVIATVVVSAVAMVLSAGAFAAIAGVGVHGLGIGGLIANGLSVLGGTSVLGTATTMGISLSAGFVSSLAGQGAANALNLQKGLDYKSALITGLATAASAGVNKFLSGSSIYNSMRQTMNNASPSVFNITNAAEMMERDALGQGINQAFQHHQHFDWIELGASSATAGIMGSTKVQDFSNYMNEKIGAGASFISTELESLATNGATAAATGSHFDAGQILTNNFGSAVSSGIMQSAKNHVDAQAYCPISEEELYSEIREGGYQGISGAPNNQAWNYELINDWDSDFIENTDGKFKASWHKSLGERFEQDGDVAKAIVSLNIDDLIGRLSMEHETGKKPSDYLMASQVVSNGVNDDGGISYGAYQLSSAKNQVQTFLKMDGSRWASEFKGLDPKQEGLFGRKWKSIAKAFGDDFFMAQHTYIERKLYSPVVEYIYIHTGLNINLQPKAVKDSVWSASVQHGRAKYFLTEAVNSLRGADQSSIKYAKDLINAIYDKRMAYVATLNIPQKRNLLEKRYPHERQGALDMLKNSY